MNNFIKVHFVLRRPKNRSDVGILYLRISGQFLKIENSLRVELHFAQWDNKAQRVRGNGIQARQINSMLEDIRMQVEQHRRFLIENEIPLTNDTLRKALKGELVIGKSIMDAITYHNNRAISLIGDKYSKASVEKYKRVATYFREFLLLNYNVEDLPLKGLKPQMVREFDDFLRTHKHHQHNTAVKFIRSFKTIINMARVNEWISHDPFLQYKEPIKTVEKPKLNRFELLAIQNKHISKERLARVRDVFVFACYTGMSFSDIASLIPSDIVVGIDGNHWIQKQRTKTGIKYSIPLLPIPKRIIAKYKEDPYCLQKGVLLPMLSNQKYNCYLKELGDICSVDINLTSHTARHTFATTVTLENGVSLESVSKMLGHSNTNMTQHYGKITERRIADEMAILKEKLP